MYFKKKVFSPYSVLSVEKYITKIPYNSDTSAFNYKP